MGSPLPEIPFGRFLSALQNMAPVDLPSPVYEALFLHYSELRRWNPRLSLVGPGTASEVLSRHYGESLAALPMIRPSDRRLVDVGSGAGFPGMVLVAACPHLDATLVEARERKWAFLKSSARRSGLSCSCLNARVGPSLPEDFPTRVDVVTCRAVALSPGLLETFSRRSSKTRFLLWAGREMPALPPDLVVSRELETIGGEHRRILEIRTSCSEP